MQLALTGQSCSISICILSLYHVYFSNHGMVALDVKMYKTINNSPNSEIEHYTALLTVSQWLCAPMCDWSCMSRETYIVDINGREKRGEKIQETLKCHISVSNIDSSTIICGHCMRLRLTLRRLSLSAALLKRGLFEVAFCNFSRLVCARPCLYYVLINFVRYLDGHMIWPLTSTYYVVVLSR